MSAAKTMSMKKTTKNKKSSVVSFADTASMRLSRHINDYSQDEIQRCFYQSNDFIKFKQDVKSTVRMIEEQRTKQTRRMKNDSATTTTIVDDYTDDEVHCERGAEKYTKESLRIKSNRRYVAKRAVFNIQYFLVTDDDTSSSSDDQEQKIAIAYGALTCTSSKDAHKIGLEDERFVMMQQMEQQQTTIKQNKNNNDNLKNNRNLFLKKKKSSYNNDERYSSSPRIVHTV